MARTRVSTTVDDDLLQRARALAAYTTDSALLDAALSAYVDQKRSEEIDAAYIDAYERHPVDEPDEWGDLASWGMAVRRSSST